MHYSCRVPEFWSIKISSSKIAQKEGFVLTDEGWTLGLPERLLFDFNNAQLKQSHQAELVRLTNQLNKYDLNKLKIVGHTDDVVMLHITKSYLKSVLKVCKPFLNTWI